MLIVAIIQSLGEAKDCANIKTRKEIVLSTAQQGCYPVAVRPSTRQSDGAMAILPQMLSAGNAPEPLSMEGFKQMGQLLLSAFTGSTSTVEGMIAEGDKVVSRLTFRGTHTGDLMGIPPTGMSVTISEIIIDRLADGKIVESWRLFDQMAMMQQLGVIPAPGQSGS
jgi:predicted ester cyclase